MVPYEDKKREQRFDYNMDIDVNIDIDLDTDDVEDMHFKEKILARAYVPFQKAGNLFHPEEALIKGTVYPELYRPYKPDGHGRHIV